MLLREVGHAELGSGSSRLSPNLARAGGRAEFRLLTLTRGKTLEFEVASRARATTSSTNNAALCDFYRVYVYQRRVVKFEPGKR